MRFLANENIPSSVIRNLRDAGHDVVSVKEIMRSAPDIDVLSHALKVELW